MNTITCDRCGKVLQESLTVTVSISKEKHRTIYPDILLQRFKDYCDVCLPKIISEIGNVLIKKE